MLGTSACGLSDKKVLLFGATGMVGQGVLRECLRAADVERVLSVGRTPLGQSHPKLDELVHADLFDLAPVADRLKPFDACFFCLGVSAAGLSEAEYTRMTFDLTLAVARTLAPLNPQMTFVYVSGAGTDSSEKGPSMWARVKGRTENALLELPFKAVCLFRPGMIQPLDGIRSKTPLYQIPYTLFKPVLPLLRRLFPKKILTTAIVGVAMIEVTRGNPVSRVLETEDIYHVVRE